jgi:osmotically-inducible protein OsmY
MGVILKVRSTVDCGRLLVVVSAVIILSQLICGQTQAQEGKTLESSSVTSDHDSVSLEAHHHYQSPADRANDALLKTEVYSALADDGVAEDSPIIVDCDHGKILLTGVMKSAEDAKRAEQIAADAPGVVAVKNQLTWH